MKTTPKTRLFLAALSTLLTLGSVAFVAKAQNDRVHPPIIIVPPRPIPPIWPPRPIPPILNQELQLVSQNAQVQINGATAKTKLKQIFQNNTNRRIEGTYIFPLPEGAAVSGFAMTVNGKRMEAEILEGDKAREIYTGIVQKLRDPAILEFIDRNLIKAKIFPIAPGAKQTMELEYSQALRADSNAYRYVVPLRLPLGGTAQQASVDIKITSRDGIKAVYSPTHDIDVQREKDSARVTGEWGKKNDKNGSDRDFVLYYTAAKSKVGVNLITQHVAGEDGYFMMLVAPDPEIAATEIAAKDVVFVFDTSGSMQGEKIEQARKALLNLLGNLNPDDRFNIVTFSSDTREFRDGLVDADKSTLSAAREWIGKIKAVGGTNINEALVQSLRMLPNRGHTQQIIFLTDGQPTVGETDVSRILKNIREQNFIPVVNGRWDDETLPAKARIFAFGVGYDVNTRLLDTLAADNRGSTDYVLPSEDIEQKVGSLYNKIAFPVLSNPKMDWNGLKVYDVYPKNMPDLFKGSQTVVFGRYEGQSTSRPQLIGIMNGRNITINGQGDFSNDNENNDVIPRLWATRKIGYLMDEARLGNHAMDDEVKVEIIKLSKKFGILTPLTAGLITEDEREVPIFRGQRGAIGAPGARDDKSRITALENVIRGPAPSTGAGAVYASKRDKDFREAVTVRSEENLRAIEGKSFVLKDGVWTDTIYDAAKSPKIETIKFASPEYFDLLKDKRMAKWLSLGERVLIVLDRRVIRIEP